MPLELKNINGNGGFTLVNTSGGGGFSLFVSGSNLSPSPSISLTPTISITPTPTDSPLVSVTPTISVTPSVTNTPTITPTITPTPTQSIPNITPSLTPSPTQGITSVITNLFEGNSSSVACVINNNRAADAYVRTATLGVNVFVVGKQWYANSSLTTPYPVGYYADLGPYSDNYQQWVRIDANGVVAEVGSCVSVSTSPTPTVTTTPTITPSPTVTPTISVTPSITPSSAVGVTFSQAFTQNTAPTTTIETAWNTFRAALTGTYTQFVWSSTNGNSLTVTHPTLVQSLANGLRTATVTSVTINSVIWRVGTGCGTPKIGGVAVEFSNIGSCSASSTYALRPMINNANWGGTNQYTVGAASQTITLTFS